MHVDTDESLSKFNEQLLQIRPWARITGLRKSYMIHARQWHHSGIMVSGCPVQAPTSPTPYPLHPCPCRRQPQGKTCCRALAQQSSWASVCWQLAQGWRRGRLGLGTGQQPDLPQVPQQSRNGSCSSALVFSRLH